MGCDTHECVNCISIVSDGISKQTTRDSCLESAWKREPIEAVPPNDISTLHFWLEIWLVGNARCVGHGNKISRKTLLSCFAKARKFRRLRDRFIDHASLNLLFSYFHIRVLCIFHGHFRIFFTRNKVTRASM